MKIILASASPRRKELIRLIDENAICIPTDIDESVPSNIEIENAPEFLACKKALSLKSSEKDAIIIGCDTAVFIDNIMLGKPKDSADAFNMLSLLSGRTHKVITGCCIVKGEKTISFSCTSNVTFLDLNIDDINDYIKSGEPFDKAGSYGIQGKGSLLIEKIEGDYFNIVGLPVSLLNKFIKKYFK